MAIDQTLSSGMDLRNVREKLGLTQAKLALTLEVSRHTIVKWESQEQIPKIVSLALERLASIEIESIGGIVTPFRQKA